MPSENVGGAVMARSVNCPISDLRSAAVDGDLAGDHEAAVLRREKGEFVGYEMFLCSQANISGAVIQAVG